MGKVDQMPTLIPDEFKDTPEAVNLREAEARFKAAAEEAKDAVKLGVEQLRVAGERLRRAQNELQAAQKAFDAATGEPRPVGLTPAVVEEVERLFPIDDHAEAINLLDRECGRTLPFHRESTADHLEHIRLCVLRLSRGNLTKLREWVKLANMDTRDVLYASSIDEHPQE